MKKLKLLLFGVVLTALLVLPGAAMAKSNDRDHDKLPDKWEKKFHLSTHKKSGKGDPDRDGLTNRGEFKSKTNPRKADSDGDGIKDATDDQDHDGVDNSDELRDGTNPCDRDSDDDGVGDGDEVAGTVESFVEDSANPGTGVLTIKLADNSTVSGKVDSSTEIECRTPRTTDDSTTRQRHGADEGPNHDVGDDHGGDRGGDHSGPGRGGDDDHGDDERNCTTADLTPGTAVHEAEFHGSGPDAVFEEIKLLK
jgi:hypothetical protein